MNEVEDLHRRLDALWVRYLALLDQYTLGQANMKKEMASGFLSIAEANFKSSKGRFGQDYYDQRTSATARVIVTGGNSEQVDLHIVRTQVDHVETDTASKTEVASAHATNVDQIADRSSKDLTPKIKEPMQLPSPSLSPEPEDTPSRSKTTGPPSPIDEHETRKPVIPPNDPIRWFGLLVPPALRAAQSSFAAAVLGEESLPKAVIAARLMRDVENEIRELRKVLKRAKKRQMK